MSEAHEPDPFPNWCYPNQGSCSRCTTIDTPPLILPSTANSLSYCSFPLCSIAPFLANPLILPSPAIDTPAQPPSQLLDLSRFALTLFDFSFSFKF